MLKGLILLTSELKKTAKHNERVIEHDDKFNFSLTPSLACQLFTHIFVAITKFNLVNYGNTSEQRPTIISFI